MYCKSSHLELQLDVYLCLFSHLFPESEPKCPTGSAGLARSSKKVLTRSSWVSKYGSRVIKMAAECVRMQPAGPKNMPPDCPGCPDAARGSQKEAPKNTAHVRHPPTSVLLLARRLFCPKSGDLHNKTYVTTSNMGLHTQMSQHVYM
jgi:hypothetical protein